jgi:hypothetical protein
MTTKTHLTLDEENAVETLIDASIIARYDSEIEYREAYGDECSYFPLDRITLRELLVELWGNLLAPEAIEAAFARLVKDGAEEWPNGWQDYGDAPIHYLRIAVAADEESAAEAEEAAEAFAALYELEITTVS